MNTRFALTLIVLLPVLAACGRSANTAPINTAAPSANAAAPASPAAAASTPAVDPTAHVAPKPSAAVGDNRKAVQPRAPNGPEPVEGTDYLLIDGGQPYQPAAGKIEVAEVFGYICPACNAFQSLIGPWKAGLPADVHFVYVPAMFGGAWDDYARAFYAAETLGIQEKTHDALYKAIHQDHVLKGESGRDSLEDIAHFYASYGVNPQQFIDTMKSFGVSAKTSRAKQFITRSKITGTPSLIIDGKYLVKGQTFSDMLRIADHLIARERATLAR